MTLTVPLSRNRALTQNRRPGQTYHSYLGDPNPANAIEHVFVLEAFEPDPDNPVLKEPMPLTLKESMQFEKVFFKME